MTKKTFNTFIKSPLRAVADEVGGITVRVIRRHVLQPPSSLDVASASSRLGRVQIMLRCVEYDKEDLSFNTFIKSPLRAVADEVGGITVRVIRRHVLQPPSSLDVASASSRLGRVQIMLRCVE
ncbi:hypothetical protein ABMA28_015562 [Loxostege sticticalis]|uniref:Uncharacterized protein n=1 Tax=Loxostege sticticalis TaxID=481309 RepID=A0ABD0TCA9_LOXSC